MAMVRRKSADTQEFQAYKQNCMHLHVDESHDEPSFVSSAVSRSIHLCKDCFILSVQDFTGCGYSPILLPRHSTEYEKAYTVAAENLRACSCTQVFSSMEFDPGRSCSLQIFHPVDEGSISAGWRTKDEYRMILCSS